MTAPGHVHRLLPSAWQRPPWWLIALLGTAIFCFRRPDAFVNPQFWAEDGMFFHQNHADGLSALFLQYQGYYHLVPRLVALSASFLDPLFAPAYYAFMALALSLYVALRTQSPRLPLARNLGYALGVVLVPDCPDTLMNITSVQFILAGGLFLLAISDDPHGPIAWIHDCLGLVLLGLTGPFSVIFAPLFLLRAYQRRTRASRVLAAIALAMAGVQLHPMLAHPLPAGPEARIAWAYLMAVPTSRVACSLLLGRLFDQAHNLALLNLAAIAILGGLGGVWYVRKDRPLHFTLMALGCLLLIASGLFRQRHGLPPLVHAGQGSRYFYAPQLLALWMLLDLQEIRSRWGMTARFLLGLFVVANCTRWREPALPDLNWAAYAPQIRAGQAVTIPINPSGWTITLPAKPLRQRTTEP